MRTCRPESRTREISFLYRWAEQVKNFGKSVEKFANADVVINSNDKGYRMMSLVHDIQVYNAEKSLL